MSQIDFWLWLLDAILILIAAEAALGSAYFLWKRRGIAPASWIANAMAGGCLVLAARLAMGGSPPLLAAIALLVALVAHVVDCRQRWR